MSRAHKKYRREAEAWRDKWQATFSKTAIIKKKQPPKTTVESKYSSDELFACPLCLALYKFQQYLISTKHGFHQGLAQCPECNNKFRIKTLTKAMTPTEYAEYIHNQALSGIWQKMPFQKWKERLWKLGWASEFWRRYRELKAEDTDKEPIPPELEKQIEDDWEAYEKRYGGGQT